MESTFVIKVKYGETLRRFNAPILPENSKLDLDMDALRAKICSLFDFLPDADLKMTYIDEDGDVVTLVDDDDLCDVIRQQLKFLMIDVQLSSERSSRTSVRSSETSTPLRSSQTQKHFPNINARFSEILKSLPEPFNETLTIPQNVADESPKPPPSATTASSKSKFVEISSENFPVISVGNLTETLGDDPLAMSSPFPANLNDPPTNSNKSEPLASTSTSDMKKETNEENKKETTQGFVGGISGIDSTGDYLKECPYSFMWLTGDSPVPPVSCGYNPPALGGCNRFADMGLFHTGIICDGCEVLPITGPRFKSMVKEDFDLCGICFAKMGNETDYIRIDHPISRQHSRSFQHPRVDPSVIPHNFRGCGSKHDVPKLESRFIMDVNVLDGTIMAPCTPFTKIWKISNNGSLDWPKGTQLMWIGGDRFSRSILVDIEISGGCIPVDKEVDIAVDFVAPELPGLYISHWRMASPSGQKFGQRIWVLIKVDASHGRTFPGSLQDLNLNLLPPQSSVVNAPDAIDINIEPCEENSILQANSVKPVDKLPKNVSETYFPIDDTLLIGQRFPLPTAPPTLELASAESSPVLVDQKLQVPTHQIPPLLYPVIDVSVPAPVVVAPPLPEDESYNKEIEEALLKELEEMGFKQVSLNKEILRINEYNLEQSVDDLCGVSQWDPFLEDLAEMGFCDKVKNKKLLVKNNGSMKQVIMDLISGQKP